MIDEATAQAQFEHLFNAKPSFAVRCPGRINLIGEHIDYCGGLVMPMAIAQSTQGWYRFNGTSQIRIYSARFDALSSFNPHDVLQPPKGTWEDYVQGILNLGAHRQAGCGFDLLVTSDLNAGGLSSSASFLGLLALVNHHALTGARIESRDVSQRLTLALLCQQVENQFVGVPSGIMDPASVLLGGLMTLDCRTLKFQPLQAIPETHRLVIMDTGVPRTLAASGYAQRVAEVGAIETLIANRDSTDITSRYAGLATLPDDQMAKVLALLASDPLKHRARHIFSEQARVVQAALALEKEDMGVLGHLMNESHQSLSVEYDVSCPELDLITQLSRDSGLALGARMTGAGFGGCAISLVPVEHLEAHQAWVMRAYRQQTGIEPILLASEVAEGANIIAL